MNEGGRFSTARVDRHGNVYLVFQTVFWFALCHHVAVELARQHVERAVQQTAFLEEFGQSQVDFLRRGDQYRERR